MKTTTSKKLSLSRETLHTLTNRQLDGAVGGTSNITQSCAGTCACVSKKSCAIGCVTG